MSSDAFNPPLLQKRALSVIALLMDKPEGVGILELKYAVFGKRNSGGGKSGTFERGLEDIFSMGIAFVSRYDDRGRPVISLQRNRFEKSNAVDPLQGKLSGDRTQDHLAFRRQRVSYSVSYEGAKLSLHAACKAAGLPARNVYTKLREHGYTKLSDAVVQAEFEKALDRLRTGEYVFVSRKDKPERERGKPVETILSSVSSIFQVGADPVEKTPCLIDHEVK